MTRRIAGAVTLLFALVAFASTAQAQISCAEAQNRFSAIDDAKTYGEASSISKSWADVQKAFGVPDRADENKPIAGSTTLTYSLNGCDLQFIVGPSGKVTTKTFTLRAAALGTPARTAVLPTPAVGVSPASLTELSAAVGSMERTLAQLQEQVVALQRTLATIKAQLPRSAASSELTPVTSVQMTLPASALDAVPANASPLVPSAQAAKPLCSESGSCYGDISADTGKAKTVYVPGYTRKDGTYVRGYYRSK
jgi:hypothetical protein